MKSYFLIKFLSLWLILAIGLPAPAFALREIQTRNSGEEKQELTKALLNHSAAGAEEAQQRLDQLPELQGKTGAELREALWKLQVETLNSRQPD